MIIGNPYKFAILFQRVDAWNRDLTDNNGAFALCIDGKLFPKFPNDIINTIIPRSVYDIKDSLENIPVNEEIFDMNKKEAFSTLNKLVYPEFDGEKSDEENIDGDYRYELSVEYLNDHGGKYFAVKKDGKMRILAANLDYNYEESNYIFDGVTITEVILEKDYINKIINQLEEAMQSMRRV